MSDPTPAPEVPNDPDSINPPPQQSAEAAARMALVSLICDRLLVGLCLVCGVVLLRYEERDFALMLFGGCLGTLRPLATRPALVRSMPLLMGAGALAASHLLTGCGQARTVLRTTCGAVAVADELCHRADLSPDSPCPLPLEDAP